MPSTLTPEDAVRTIWIGWWISWLAAAAWSDRAARRPAAGSQVGYRVLAVAGMLLLFGIYRRDVRWEIVLWRSSTPLTWIFAAMTACGLLFTWWARIHLGRLWSSSVGRKADHHVVDTGPYALVRHPIYTGIIFASAATAAMRGTAVAWLGAAIMTAGWVVKARLEEAFLRQELGAGAYGDYARRVPMLVPFVGRGRPRSTD